MQSVTTFSRSKYIKLINIKRDFNSKFTVDDAACRDIVPWTCVHKCSYNVSSECNLHVRVEAYDCISPKYVVKLQNFSCNYFHQSTQIARHDCALAYYGSHVLRLQ